MKISKLFHWLYASLCFLPLLVAPIFAIYTRNESATYTESIQVEQNKVVEFNQLIEFHDFDYSYNGLDYSSSSGIVTVNGTSTGRSNVQLYLNRKSTIDSSHQLLIKGVVGSSSTQYLSFVYYSGGSYLTYNTYFDDYIFSMPSGADEYQLEVVGAQVADLTLNNYKVAPQLFDLTLMFGSGNEPTIQQFNSWYTEYFYSYDSGTYQLLKNYDTITYSNTDIGSQFVYTMYTTTEQYLNFDNVFNLYQVYDWIELNVFNGNAPLYFTIAWHYLDYWLLISIFWLCFDILIYVPQIAHRWLDKAALE